MAKFKITPTTTVAELKEQFSNEVGGVLRIYEGRSEAADGATLVSLGAKEGELECRTSRTVGKFEEAFQNDLNLKVKVYTKDNWVKVLDGITLATAAELPNGMTKAKMEEYLSHTKDEKDDENDINDASIEDETNNPKRMNKDEKLDLLQQELDKVLDWDVKTRINEMFFDIIPEGTIIYSTNSAYKKYLVAYPIHCFAEDCRTNSFVAFKAVKFKVENRRLYVIQYISDDEDELCDESWHIELYPQNYQALSVILWNYKIGHHSAQDDITLVMERDIDWCDDYEEED